METNIANVAMEHNIDSMWDSPIGGAYLIWRFVAGYAVVRDSGPNMLLVYPALAIVMDSSFAVEIRRANNLADFAFAFHDSSGKKAKSLSGLQERIVEQRDWTLKSIEFALATRLVELIPETASLRAILEKEAASSENLARDFKDNEGLNAELLGGVFAHTQDSDIAYYLGVKF